MAEFFLNWNNCISIFVKNAEKDNPIFKSKDFLKNIDNFSAFRWRILSVSVSIENWLDHAIEYLMFDEKNQSSYRFSSSILKSWMLTYFQKRKVFKDLCKNRDWEKSTHDKVVIWEIHKCIELRNNVAHWTIYYDWKDNAFYFVRIKWMQESSIKITETYILDTSKKLYSCINKLNTLLTDP